jgi:hypothetical protein
VPITHKVESVHCLRVLLGFGTLSKVYRSCFSIEQRSGLVIMKLFLLIFIYFIHNCSPRVSPVDSNLFGLLEYRLNQAIISGKALKGEIKGAKVEAFAMNSEAVCNFSAPLASSTTNEAGEYSLTLRKTGSPVCIRVSPQLTGTRVFDEKMGRDLPIDTPASLNLVHIFREDMNSSSNRSTIFISPFSRMIHNRVQTLAKANPNTSVSQLTRKAGREVVIRFGLTRGLSQSRGFSSRSVNEAEFPDIDEIAPQFNDSGNSVGMKFLALLSAFSQLAYNNKKGAQVSSEDIDSIVEAFAKDMSDGKFDGRDASGEKVLLGNGRPLGENPLSNQLLPALNQFFQEGGQIGNEPVSSQFLNSISFADATPIQSEIPISEPVLPADSITFIPGTYTLTVGDSVIISPSIIGIVTSCNITPTIPAGLTLGPECQITGSPTTPVSPQGYTVTANFSGNILSATLTIGVNNPSPVSYIFSNAGAVGRTGPTQAMINSAYSGSNLQGAVTVQGSGIQEWIAPASGTYIIEAMGAQGATDIDTIGLGAKIKGTFLLNSGDKLFILVGQKGQGTPGTYSDVGGGGGSFVSMGTALNTSNLLVAAGGGAGSHSMTNEAISNGSTNQNGNSGRNSNTSAGIGGISGGAGGVDPDNCSHAAAGFSGSGASAQSFLSGGLGAQSYDGLKDGGFGGGGAPANNSGLCAYSTAGGGGGYSGGGSSGAANGYTFPGGGGGSFNGGSSPLNTAGFRVGHGIVIITYTP